MSGILSLSLISVLSFTRHTVGNLSGGIDVSAADFDGDGDVDIVGAGRSANQLVWFEWLGPNSFTPHLVFTADEVIGCWAGDLDGDGDCDLAAATDTYLVWFANNGAGSFTPDTVYNTAGCGWRVNAADVDGDSDLDLLFTDWTESDLFWFENDGSENFVPHLVDANLNWAHEVWGLNIDGDGDCDLIGTDWLTGDIYWYDNNGSQVFTKRLVGNTGSASYGCWDAFPYDIDGDGDPDIAGTNYNGNGAGNGYVRWFENNGAGGWTTHAVDEAYSGNAHGVCVADFNGDNRGDIIVAGYGTHVNGYEYPSWAMTGIDIVSASLAVYPLDIDHDGDTDFALSSNTFYWYENTTPVASQENEAMPDYGMRASYRRGLLELNVTLPAGTPYDLELYLVSGARMRTLEKGIAPDNDFSREYRLDAPPGVYYLVLMAGGFTRSAKILVD